MFFWADRVFARRGMDITKRLSHQDIESNLLMHGSRFSCIYLLETIYSLHVYVPPVRGQSVVLQTQA